MIPGSGYLLDDRYSADRNIASVSPIPVLILHGTADHVIPWQDSEKLYALAREPKQKSSFLTAITLMLFPDVMQTFTVMQ